MGGPEGCGLEWGLKGSSTGGQHGHAPEPTITYLGALNCDEGVMPVVGGGLAGVSQAQQGECQQGCSAKQDPRPYRHPTPRLGGQRAGRGGGSETRGSQMLALLA